MPARLIQNNFGGGEISPVLYGRSDLQAYYKGCASAENFVVSKEGTLRKRRGIRTFAELETDYATSVVVPYRYDRTVAAAIVVTDAGENWTLSLYDKTLAKRAEAAFEGAGSVKGIQAKQIGDQVWITNGSVDRYVTVTYCESEGMETWSMSVSQWAHSNKPSNVNSFSAVGHAADGSIYDGSGETSIGYCAAIVVDGVMSNYKTSSAYQKKSWAAGAYVSISVSITSEQYDAGFDYVVVGKSVGGTYGELTRFYPEDFSSDSLTKSYTDKNVSPGDGIYKQTDVLGGVFANPLCVDCFQQRKVFANADIGKEKRLTVTSRSSVAVPSDFSRLIRAYVKSSGVDVTPTVANGTITFESSGTYVVEYEVADSFDRFPMTMWFSEVGNLNNFWANRPTVDSDAFSPTISSTGPAFIRWICSFQDSMILFTDCGLFSVGFTQTSGFSASSCRISKFSDLAVSETVQPIVTDAGVVFVGADRKTLYTISYSLEENSLKPINRTVLVEHLTRTNRIVSIALQEFPDNVVWVVLEDGTFATFTFERNEEVYAWSHGRIDGARVLDAISLGSVTDGLPGRTYTDLVFVVEKTVGETSVQYLAKAVEAYSDTVGESSSSVVAMLRTLRPESQERTLAGIAKNVKDVLVRLYETGSLKVRPLKAGTDVPLVKAKTGDGLFSGDVKVMPAGYVNDSGQMTFVSDDASPCEILMTVSTVEVG